MPGEYPDTLAAIEGMKEHDWHLREIYHVTYEHRCPPCHKELLDELPEKAVSQV
jgi:hypothetical protein